LKLLTIDTRAQADTDKKVPTNAHIIMLFARFVFSSSPLDTRYIIPPTITARTAITATYLIPTAITPHSTLYRFVSFEGHGSPPQFTSGILAPKACHIESNAVKVSSKSSVFFMSY